MRRLYDALSLPARYALVLAPMLALLWAGVGHEITNLNAVAERESRHDVANLSQGFAEEVGATVGSIDLSLIALRSHWRASPESFRAFLAELSQSLQNKVVFQIAITDAHGVLVYSSSDAAPAPLDLSDREHIRAQLHAGDDRLFISKPVLGRVSHRQSVQFTRPILDAQGRLSGVIVASVAPGYFSRFHDRIFLGEHGAISVSREDGVVLARSSHEGRERGLGERLNHERFDKAGDGTGEFLAVSPIDGIARIYSARRLPEYGLVVSVGQSAADAKERYASQRGMYIGAGVGVSLLVALLCWSITEAGYRRGQLHRQIADAEARWKFALEGAGEGVWDWDIRARRAYLSPRMRDMLHIGQDTMHCDPDTLRALIHPEDVRLVSQTMQAHLEGVIPAYELEFRVQAGEAAWIWVLSRGMVVSRAPDGKPLRVVGTLCDISERKAREAQVQHLAQHDALTGLPNRALLADRLRQALMLAQRNKGKLAVIYFDLDRFKPVNDRYGHEVGDLLLREVAQRTASCLRQTDTVGRIGGDEFVVVLPGISEEADAMAVASSILATISAPFLIDGHLLDISCSLGVATYPSDGDEEAMLMRCADRAMYQAKQQGRGCVCRYRKSAPSSAVAPA